jgi:hypothetical protein
VKKYTLEIYSPGSRGSDVTCTIESDEPFMPLQVGDLINPRAWTTDCHHLVNSNNPSKYGVLLKVIGVEHFIFMEDEHGFVGHKLGVFTAAVDDIEDARPV